ncbi:hypothetical protein FLQ13_03565 [Bacillus halotolerans]|nr:hypothetical protein FLQ13_03565 [Bacillus halotolerans]
MWSMKEALLCFAIETAADHKNTLMKAGIFSTCRLFIFFILSISLFTTKNEPYELLTEKWKNEIL